MYVLYLPYNVYCHVKYKNSFILNLNENLIINIFKNNFK